jgi:hypothetical protein
MQILFGNVNVGGADASLQMLPKVFQSVDVRIVQNIFLRSMIHRLVCESFFVQSLIGAQFVRVNRRTLLNICFNNRMQSFLANIWDNFRHHLSVALQHSKNNRLVASVAASHSPCPSADIRFITLNLAGQRKFAVHFRHVLPDLMTNAKRAFVSHAKLTLQFFARNAMPRSGEQIHGIKPKLQRCPAVFKQCADCGMKMMAAMLARIGALRFDAMPLGFLFALRAGIILAETSFKNMIQAGFIIAKLREKFSDRHAVFVTVVPVLHALNLRLNRYVCQGDNSEFFGWRCGMNGRKKILVKLCG